MIKHCIPLVAILIAVGCQKKDAQPKPKPPVVEVIPVKKDTGSAAAKRPEEAVEPLTEKPEEPEDTFDASTHAVHHAKSHIARALNFKPREPSARTFPPPHDHVVQIGENVRTDQEVSFTIGTDKLVAIQTAKSKCAESRKTPAWFLEPSERKTKFSETKTDTQTTWWSFTGDQVAYLRAGLSKLTAWTFDSKQNCWLVQDVLEFPHEKYPTPFYEEDGGSGPTEKLETQLFGKGIETSVVSVNGITFSRNGAAFRTFTSDYRSSCVWFSWGTENDHVQLVARFSDDKQSERCPGDVNVDVHEFVEVWKKDGTFVKGFTAGYWGSSELDNVNDTWTRTGKLGDVPLLFKGTIKRSEGSITRPGWSKRCKAAPKEDGYDPEPWQNKRFESAKWELGNNQNIHTANTVSQTVSVGCSVGP